MLERALARDLGNGAEVVLHFEPEGLRARLGFVPEGGMAARAVPLEGVPA
jgi:hypothetical protein